MPHLQFRVIECENFQLIMQLIINYAINYAETKVVCRVIGGVLASQRPHAMLPTKVQNSLGDSRD